MNQSSVAILEKGLPYSADCALSRIIWVALYPLVLCGLSTRVAVAAGSFSFQSHGPRKLMFVDIATMSCINFLSHSTAYNQHTDIILVPFKFFIFLYF
jgi:hypothetical protein